MLECYHYQEPDFQSDLLEKAPEVQVQEVTQDGIVPTGFYLTTHLPTYFKIQGQWQLPSTSSINCVAVVADQKIQIKEIRDVRLGDHIVMSSKSDGSQGVFVHKDGFHPNVYRQGGDFVEASNSSNYELIYKLLENEQANGGYIAWVLGPAVVFDYNTRNALSNLARHGYVHSLLGGNAMVTHDLEGGYLNTALGQDIYTQETDPLGHYNHLDLLNEVRRAGSIKEFIDQGHVKDGFVKTLVGLDIDVPITLAGSIRDDGPLPEVTGDVYESLTNAKTELNKATLIICLATTLHSVSTADLASSYRIDKDGQVRPVFLYTIDVTENAVRKVLAARDHVAARAIVTNVQDFIVNLEDQLIIKAAGEEANRE